MATSVVNTASTENKNESGAECSQSEQALYNPRANVPEDKFDEAADKAFLFCLLEEYSFSKAKANDITEKMKLRGYNFSVDKLYKRFYTMREQQKKKAEKAALASGAPPTPKAPATPKKAKDPKVKTPRKPATPRTPKKKADADGEDPTSEQPSAKKRKTPAKPKARAGLFTTVQDGGEESTTSADESTKEGFQLAEDKDVNMTSEEVKVEVAHATEAAKATEEQIMGEPKKSVNAKVEVLTVA